MTRLGLCVETDRDNRKSLIFVRNVCFTVSYSNKIMTQCINDPHGITAHRYFFRRTTIYLLFLNKEQTRLKEALNCFLRVVGERYIREYLLWTEIKQTSRREKLCLNKAWRGPSGALRRTFFFVIWQTEFSQAEKRVRTTREQIAIPKNGKNRT